MNHVAYLLNCNVAAVVISGKHCETCGILLKSILVAVVSSDKLLACLLIRIVVTVVTSSILCDRLVYLLSSNVAAEVT